MDIERQIPLEKLFSNLLPIMSNPAPFKDGWEDAGFYLQAAQQTPILVIGAGGLGCQIVKNLALSGIKNIHLVDMDTVDFTNLNRQFMFREKDINKYKADVIASFVKQRFPSVQITTYKKRVQQISFSQYLKFPIIVGGLDNVQARKYLNNIVFQVNRDQEQTRCYYIDGATEGFNGQALFVNPYQTSCYECSLLQGLTSKPKVNYCTIANTPRTPQHCIQYVMEVLWEEQRGQEVRDNDNLEHMKWVYQKSLQRAKKFKIQGVTQMLTLGVTKNIIPAIACTNALIAAVCTNQVLKLLSGCNPTLNNFLLYKGGSSIGSQTYQSAKLQSCYACKTRVNYIQDLNLNVNKSWNLHGIIQQVKKTHHYVNRPFVNYNETLLLNPGDSQRYPTNINLSIDEMIQIGKLKDEKKIRLTITDKCLKSQLRVILSIEEIQMEEQNQQKK